MTLSVKLPTPLCRFLTICGSNVASRSRGVSTSACPKSRLCVLCKEFYEKWILHERAEYQSLLARHQDI